MNESLICHTVPYLPHEQSNVFISVANGERSGVGERRDQGGDGHSIYAEAEGKFVR